MDNLAIKAAGFIDLHNQNINLHENECLYIENGFVVDFRSEQEVPDNCQIIEMNQTFVLPGLVDTAFLPHLMFGEDGKSPINYGESVWRAKEASFNWLRAGITSAGSLGAVDRLDKELGECISNGKFPGPRITSALTPLVPAGGTNFSWGYGVREVSGANDARSATRELIKQGADRIVIYSDPPLRFFPSPEKTCRERLSFSLEELSEIVTQASYAGCFVHAQALSRDAIKLCAMAGVRSIGCAYQLDHDLFPLLKDKKVAIAPNLALGLTIQESGLSVGLSEAMISMVAAQRINGQLLLEAREFGIEIICGTNAVFTQGDVAKECLCLESIGFSRAEALCSATLFSARSLKPFSQIGAFAKNHFADFIFLRANPLEDLNNLYHIEKIMLAGKFVESSKGGAN